MKAGMDKMNIFKQFFYKNDCVLCVWARYCLFVLIGLTVGFTLGFKVIVIFASVMLFLMCFFAVLARLPDATPFNESEANENY